MIKKLILALVCSIFIGAPMSADVSQKCKDTQRFVEKGAMKILSLQREIRAADDIVDRMLLISHAQGLMANVDAAAEGYNKNCLLKRIPSDSSSD